jgi:Inverse autotransporter, beta-domain/Right handed beta helix region
MKTVRTYRNWLRRLFAAGLAVSMSVSTHNVWAQNGPATYSRTPYADGASGSASGVIDSNRRGFGALFRAGYSASDTVGRGDSLSHMSLAPYINVEDGMFFGDARLGRANRGGLTWSFGTGYRHYVSAWDVVVGGNGYFARDELTGAQLQQWGVGAELLANKWEARGNLYRNMDSSSKLVNVSVDQNSAEFVGHNLLFDRIDRFAEGLEGFDAEAGWLLPGNLAEQFDIRAFGGGYYYEGDNVDGFGGWSARLQTDVANWLEMGVKLTNDEIFDTTVAFNFTMHFGGFFSQEHTRRSAIQRFAEPVRRNMNIATTEVDIRVPNQVARDPNSGSPLEFVHVNSNFAGVSLGTVENPFTSLNAAFAFTPDPDVIFTHAGSVFDSPPDNSVFLSTGQQLVGEGLLPSTVGPRSIETTIDALGVGNIILPQSPTLAAANGLLSAPEIIGTTGSGASAVTMADNTVFSGFTLRNSDLHGVYADSVSNSLLRDLLIIDTQNGSGVRLDNTRDAFALENVTIEHAFTGNSAAAFHINGGNGVVVFGSTSVSSVDPAFGHIQSSTGSALLIENMTGGLVGMDGGTVQRPGFSDFVLSGSTIDHTGGTGITIRDNASNVTVDNASVANSTGTGIAVLRSAGAVSFRHTLRSSTDIANPTLQGVLIQDSEIDGQVTFDDLTITNRNDVGIEVAAGGGDVVFNQNVSIGDGVPTPTAAGISIHDLTADSSVGFRNSVTIFGGAGPGILLSNNAAGSQILFGNSLTDTTTISNAVSTINQGVVINGQSGNATFMNLGIQNRVQEGVLISGSDGGILFNGGTTILNPQNSPFSAIDINNNTGGTIGFETVNIQAATGRPTGGAGVHLQDNGDPATDTAPAIRFSNLNIDTTPVGGTGAALFGLNNANVDIFSGIITAVGGTGVDFQNSGLNVQLTQVNSAGSADNGIRLVDTNFEDRRTFTVTGTPTSIARGTGGQIDSAGAEGVRMENAGQVTLRSMLILNNRNGIIVENGASSTQGAATPLAVDDDQFLHLTLANVEDNLFRGLYAQNLKETVITTSTFTNNGIDPTVIANTARGQAILLDYFEPLNTDPNLNRVGSFANPYEVQIVGGSFITHSTDDAVVIRNTLTNTAINAHVNVLVDNSEISLLDNVDPDTTSPGDVAFTFDWNGPADLTMTSNIMRVQHINQTIMDIRSNFLSRNNEFRFDILGNQLFATSANGQEPGNHFGIDIESFGFVDSGNIGTNLIDMTGGRGTGIAMTFASSSDVRVTDNTIFERTDDGTGILYRSVSEPSLFIIEGNVIDLADNDTGFPEPGQGERGIIFSRVLGVVNLFGRNDNIVVADVPFFIPAGSSNGQIIVNGQAVP